MPDKRKHRGPHPEDHERFADAKLPTLRSAVADLAWLLGRDYPAHAALKLVGDRFALDERQRLAVRRATCSDAARAARRQKMVDPGALDDQRLAIDGFNLLTTVEAALAGGVVLGCRDGCYRDMASVHGSWRKVEETGPALERIGEYLESLGVRRTLWFLDSPVSNSGRLKTRLREVAEARDWSWGVEVVPSPDRRLREGDDVVATADSVVIERSDRWLNLARLVVGAVDGAWIVDLAEMPE